jgi:hypothetical protein
MELWPRHEFSFPHHAARHIFYYFFVDEIKRTANIRHRRSETAGGGSIRERPVASIVIRCIAHTDLATRRANIATRRKVQFNLPQ